MKRGLCCWRWWFRLLLVTVCIPTNACTVTPPADRP